MIVVNIDKARQISHQLRREDRDAEFAPLYATIAKRIPGTTEQLAEAARQSIRDKYAEIQENMNPSQSVAQ